MGATPGEVEKGPAGSKGAGLGSLPPAWREQAQEALAVSRRQPLGQRESRSMATSAPHPWVSQSRGVRPPARPDPAAWTWGKNFVSQGASLSHGQPAENGHSDTRRACLRNGPGLTGLCNAACYQELGPSRQKAEQSAAALFLPRWEEGPSGRSGAMSGEMSWGTCVTPIPPQDPSEEAIAPYSPPRRRVQWHAPHGPPDLLSLQLQCPWQGLPALCPLWWL